MILVMLSIKHLDGGRRKKQENQAAGDISEGHRYHVKKFLVAMMEAAEQNIKSRDLEL